MPVTSRMWLLHDSDKLQLPFLFSQDFFRSKRLIIQHFRVKLFSLKVEHIF